MILCGGLFWLTLDEFLKTVFDEICHDEIGTGTNLGFESIAQVAETIFRPNSPILIKFRMGANLGQCNGGSSIFVLTS